MFLIYERMRVLVDDIGEVVTAVRTDARIIALINDPKINGLFPFYMYGHRLEIANRLLEKDMDSVYKYQKYPLIALRMDFPETHNAGQLVEYTLNIAFLMFTQMGYDTPQRYENVIRPILYPLVDIFFEKLVESGLFTWTDTTILPPCIKYDRPFYGTAGLESNEKYIFNDNLDAVELVDLKIRSSNAECL